MGKPCTFWDLKGRFAGCNYPNAKIEGRVSCEGIIDDPCLWATCGIRPKGLTDEQLKELKLIPPSLERNRMLSPGVTPDIERINNPARNLI